MIKGKAFQDMNNRQRQRQPHRNSFRTVVSKPAQVTVEFIDRGHQENWSANVQKTSMSGDKVNFLLHNGDMKVFNFQEIFSIDLKPLENPNAQNRQNPR